MAVPSTQTLSQQCEDLRIGIIDTELDLAMTFMRVAETASDLQTPIFMHAPRLLRQARIALDAAARFTHDVATPFQFLRLTQKHAHVERALVAAEIKAVAQVS